MNKPKILFVYDHKYPELWKDGLWAALKLLENDFDIVRLNLEVSKDASKKHLFYKDEFVFALGWGAFGGPVDKFLQDSQIKKKGLCLAGYANPPRGKILDYKIIFCETEWTKNWIHKNDIHFNGASLLHAFGVNTDIYYDNVTSSVIWDYLSVGSFSLWKRQTLILNKKGNRMVIGEIQKENYAESFDIISNLLLGGVAVSDMVKPETLAEIYNVSKSVYIPADIMGGGERAVLEARACGVDVEIEGDNPKLKELLTCPIWDEYYYSEQIKKGILECLK